ncbi:hypothetical protein R3P38DRAFT_2505441 [Favolaschia claudopus]|uniref:Uncharacterized protein n=1 Tax=Favolaschia claudopus TaxID=2862362 RepID=A0AAW0DCE8_9AGAR
MPSPQPSSGGGIELVRDAELLIASFLPSSPVPTAQGIPQPFCLPQIATSFDSPFARGYSPVLQNSVGISQEQLLSFVDGLNLAMTASPPLRVVNLVGNVIGFIPIHWAMIASVVIQTAAQTSMHVLSKTLTDRYLRAANQRLFKPKGLVVRICTTAAMQQLVMHSGTGEGPSTLNKIGRGVSSILLRAPLPLTHRIIRSISDKPPKVPASISTAGDGQKMPLATQRRLASLEGHAMTLNLNMPPPAKPQGIMDTMGSWTVKLDSWSAGRKENKVEQRRREFERVDSQLRRLGIDPQGGRTPPIAGPSTGYGPQQPVGYDEWSVMGRRERKQLRRERRQLRRAAKRARKRERRGPGLIGSLVGQKETRLERQVENADLLEHWATEKVLWIVIMNAELDKEIQDIELADSMQNEERVDDKTWRAEIIKEKEILEESDSDTDSDSDDEDVYGGDHKH